jgi:hypothetical protein
MSQEHYLTYPPLNTLKPVADDVWIVDGPVIRFGLGCGLHVPFPTRATIIRIERDLFVHSPTPLEAGLRGELDRIGTPRWIVGPNRLHYWWIPDWHVAWPDAEVYVAPKTAEQAGDRLSVECGLLDRQSGYPWDDAIRTLPVSGSYMTEVAFFHVPSSTLMLTDLIENFESDKVKSRVLRLLMWVGGVLDPDGCTPRDMRVNFKRNKPQVRAAVGTIVDWNPERIILAHGRWYDRGGRAELQRAFRWIIQDD